MMECRIGRGRVKPFLCHSVNRSQTTTNVNSWWTGREAVRSLLCSFLLWQLFLKSEILCKEEKKILLCFGHSEPAQFLVFGKVRALGPISWGQETVVKRTWLASVAGICKVEHTITIDEGSIQVGVLGLSEFKFSLSSESPSLPWFEDMTINGKSAFTERWCSLTTVESWRASFRKHLPP